MTVVAIDGPAGAGKSSVARGVADALGFTYLDSGAMYRTVALAALERGVPRRRSRARWTSRWDRGPARRPDVTARSARRRFPGRRREAAADPAVRAALLGQQRRLLAGDWVAEGRDIGTVVAPDADLKVFLTADPAERARRRAAELGVDAATVLAEQTIRDERDRPASTRR